MSNEENEPRPEELSDELAKKYDPERLLKIIGKRAGRGEALDHSLRNKYEKKFGVDLGHVRLVTGEFAEEFNRQRQAYAVTIGTTGMILMGNSPDKAAGSAAGSALLAHELTHVAQAQRGLHRKGYGGDMPFGNEHEAEAEAVEAHELSGGSQSGVQAVNEGQAKLKSDEKLKEDMEKIKERVLELAAEAARTQWTRNGSSRRP
jgi:hypothetical protein